MKCCTIVPPRTVPYGATEFTSLQPSSYPNPLNHPGPLGDRLNQNTSLLHDNFEPYESFARQGYSRFDDLAETYPNPRNINDDNNNERQLNADINQYQFSGSRNVDASTPWSSNAGIGTHLTIGTNSPEQVICQAIEHRSPLLGRSPASQQTQPQGLPSLVPQ
ncbi:hypothetical protein K440DRAFT_675376 [Wilcoxina mikolae CBS 423.85]|nr:hypothetical protein K440DRAFT_675376 [Wilcoxina mikolae CBS 423.85]